jgi:hypothetical protein
VWSTDGKVSKFDKYIETIEQEDFVNDEIIAKKTTLRIAREIACDELKVYQMLHIFYPTSVYRTNPSHS